MKNIKIIIIALFCVALMGGSFIKAAWAIGVNLEEVKPLTPIEYLPDAEFEAQTQLIEETPYGDEFLSYSVRLPKNWVKSPNRAKKIFSSNDASHRILGPIAYYTSPPKNHLRSFFTLEAAKLTYEIGARNWFINEVLNKGLTLSQLGKEENKQVEAIYVKVDGDITYVVRVVAIINGSRMVVARHFVPQALYEAERVEQAQILKSFKLKNRETSGIEELNFFGFLDQSFFDYPVSWVLNAPFIKSITRMRAMLHHSTVIDKLDGQINMYLTNKQTDTTRSKEIEFYRDKFQINNYELGKYLESPILQYDKDMSFGVTQAYEMNSQVSNMIDYELWVSVLEGEDYIYIVSLLTPARGEEFHTWARNVQAYRLVMKGIRRHDDDADPYRFIRGSSL